MLAGSNPVSNTIVTVGDIILSAQYESQTFHTVLINAGDMVCTWSADLDVTFWYIKVNGSAHDYGMFCVENLAHVYPLVTIFARYVHEDGHVDTIPYSPEKAFESQIPAYEYGYLSKICYAYESNDLRVDGAELIIDFAGEQVNIGRFDPPISPVLLD